jgi:alpha-tubulin suppressor-like RCC1 family protein
VSGGLTFISVSAGGGHSCAITPTGVVYCWGMNGGGQLGSGSTNESNVPLRVAGQP